MDTKTKISDILDEFYSLAWEDGHEAYNRREELNVKFYKEISEEISKSIG